MHFMHSVVIPVLFIVFIELVIYVLINSDRFLKDGFYL